MRGAVVEGDRARGRKQWRRMRHWRCPRHCGQWCLSCGGDPSKVGGLGYIHGPAGRARFQAAVSRGLHCQVSKKKQIKVITFAGNGVVSRLRLCSTVHLTTKTFAGKFQDLKTLKKTLRDATQ